MILTFRLRFSARFRSTIPIFSVFELELPTKVSYLRSFLSRISSIVPKSVYLDPNPPCLRAILYLGPRYSLEVLRALPLRYRNLGAIHLTHSS